MTNKLSNALAFAFSLFWYTGERRVEVRGSDFQNIRTLILFVGATLHRICWNSRASASV